MMGADLGNLNHYFEIFPSIISKLFPTGGLFANKLQGILQLAIAGSSLGGGYGVMFSNGWNLHALAEKNHLPGSKLIAKLNEHGVPTMCIVAEALISITYICVTQGNNIPLQQIGAFGCTLGYTFCVLALLANALKMPNQKKLILPILGIISCAVLLTSCINSFVQYGSYGPIAFFALLIAGIVMFYFKKSEATKLQKS
jgi:amino acid permease